MVFSYSYFADSDVGYRLYGVMTSGPDRIYATVARLPCSPAADTACSGLRGRGVMGHCQHVHSPRDADRMSTPEWWGGRPLDGESATTSATVRGHAEGPALVVSAADAKRWKVLLDTRGWLDRARIPQTFQPEAGSDRPAAVAFPVSASSVRILRDLLAAPTDANLSVTGALALCLLQLPGYAKADQRSKAKAVKAAAAAAAVADPSVSTDGAPLPPAPPLRPDAPLLWPPPLPPQPPASQEGCPEVRRIPCPTTREAFAATVTSLGEPVVLIGVPMGDAPRRWTDPDYFAKCPDASHVVDVHVCPPKAHTPQTEGSVDVDGDGVRECKSDGASDETDRCNGGRIDGPVDDGNRTVVVDLAGHRKPGTRRNFEFHKMPFAELIRRVSSKNGAAGGDDMGHFLDPVVAPGEKYYLRSVAHKTAAHLPASFPSLAADLRPGVILPSSVKYEGDGKKIKGEESHTCGVDNTLWPTGAYHSSVLRIASPGTALWTHYDTHDNLLAQVTGYKTVTLWAPGAEPFMYVEGSSSRVEDIDAELEQVTTGWFPKFAAVSNRRWVATLGPGEALYIPALWFHHVLSHHAPSGKGSDSAPVAKKANGVSSNSDDPQVTCGGGGMSIAVNVFWRCLPAEEHDPRDLFGNKDPPAARRASELAARAGLSIAHLPEPHRTFYARRAVQRFAAQLGMELGVL